MVSTYVNVTTSPSVQLSCANKKNKKEEGVGPNGRSLVQGANLLEGK
jgi:hypothetical protein